MKRMVLIAGLALSILSCAQHDNNSPDTSGVDPQSPNRTATGNSMTNNRDSSSLPGSTSGGNMNNDNTNNNQQVNTGDSSLNNRRNQ